MTEDETRTALVQDARLAGGEPVLYLEGKTDVPVLLGLLGARDAPAVPGGVVFENVLIRGLTGSSAVDQRLSVAQRYVIPRIFGVLDGDGDTLAQLAPDFNPTHQGPRFRWKAYCIENLLARAGWPDAWGPVPDWREVMGTFAPYVAMNRLGLGLRQRLKRLGLDRFANPRQDLWTTEQVLSRLREGKQELVGLEVETMFLDELERFNEVLAASMDEAHALFNGKWLVEVYAPRHTKRSPDVCREHWARHLREIGGDPEIKSWWRRVLALRT